MASRQVTHREQRRWSYWSGSRDAVYEIMRAGQRADEEVRGNLMIPKDARLVYGSVGYEDRDEDLQSMKDIREAIDSPDFPRMKRMTIFFGDGGFGVQSCITVSTIDDHPISLSVYGSDRMKVPGVARAIGNVIDAGKRTGVTITRNASRIGTGIGGAALIALGIAALADAYPPDWVVYTMAGLVVGPILLYQLFLPALVPRFELLPTGTSDTRVGRLRTRAATWTERIVIATIGSAAGAIVVYLITK